MTLPEGSDSTPQADANVNQFTALVADMNRLLSGLASIKIFKDADIGLDGWIALSVLAKKDGLTAKGLGRGTGVTGKEAQRVNRALSQGNFISVDPNRGNEFRITALGRSRLAAINAQFAPMLSTVLKSKERALVAAQKQLKVLKPMLQIDGVNDERRSEERQPTRARQINRLADLIGAKTYLEIGVSWGTSFFAVKVPNKVGVDPFFKFNVAEHQTPNVQFYEVTSDEFFRNHPKSENFDIVFIDGLHVFGQALRDFQNSLEVSNPGTVWIIDDVIPSDEFSALPDPRAARLLRENAKGTRSGGWHGDVYKVVFAIHDLYPDFSFVTSSIRGNGKTIVWREPRKNVVPAYGSIEAIDKMDYAEFVRRNSLINLQSEEDAFEKLAAWQAARKAAAQG